jgi:ketosteroid isomerase-like protein
VPEIRSTRGLCAAVVLGLAAAELACASPGGPSVASSEDRAHISRKIRDLEARLEAAYESNDLEAYWAFYADDVTQLWDTGPISLEEYKREWNALVEQGGGVVSGRTEDLRIRVSPKGDVAIATYAMDVTYRSPAGELSEGRYYETDVWFLRDGAWKIVHYHFSSAADALAGAPSGLGD